ncbi:MAG: 3-oxoacyl-ACP reductase FabG [Alphaproteobacteria bacterium]|nr:3-oxoacyl-ACP reductase FabG [Alphaproteobacteria bacterium]
MDDSFASLKDRVVIVTGGGRGIGRAYVHGFAKQGAITVIAEIDGVSARTVEGEIRRANGRAIAVATDVADVASVKAMVDRAMGEFGRIDVLVNNAAYFADIEMRPFYEIPDAEWDRVMRVNITGCFNCAKAAVGPMRARGFGRIVNISSSVVEIGRPNYLHYVTSKSALIGMTRGMAKELGDFGITVNAIMPGLTITEVPRKTTNEQSIAVTKAAQSIKRTETPEDLVGAVMFLASESAAFITGQTIPVDGGMVFR